MLAARLEALPRIVRLWLLVAFVVAATWSLPGPTIEQPGPTVDLASALLRDGTAASMRGEWLMTTVQQGSVPVWRAVLHVLDERVRRATAASSSQLNTAVAMTGAEQDAWTVAVRATGQDDAAAMSPAVDTRGVVGPSGGLIFALAFTDALSGGTLNGGQIVAGTGTISVNGEVGAVGGVAYKVQGAAEAGARVFLVPAENAVEAAAVAPITMTVVPVHTFDDAVNWLCRHGARGPMCAAAGGAA